MMSDISKSRTISCTFYYILVALLIKDLTPYYGQDAQIVFSHLFAVILLIGKKSMMAACFFL